MPGPDDHRLHGHRVLVLGLYYWPEATGIAPYTTAFAEHLASRGAQVTALVGVPHYPAWRVDDRYAGHLRVRETRNGVEIVRVRTYVPGKQSGARRALYEATHAMQLVTVPRLRPSDVVIGVVPTLASAVGAAFHAGRWDSALGLIVQDLSGPAASQSGVPGAGRRVADLATRLERTLLRRADRVAVVSEAFRAYAVDAGAAPERIRSLPNWSRLERPTKTPTQARRELGWPVGEPVVLHAGNMGLKQGLEHVVAAARLAVGRGPRAHFVLMGDGSQRSALEASARNLPNLTFSPPRYGADYANALAAAEVLLVNERATVLDMSLPSKLTSYFAAGRPVLGCVSPSGVTAREIERSGGGVTVPAEDPGALLDALRELLDDPERRSMLGRSGRAYSEEVLRPELAQSRAESFVVELAAAPRAPGLSSVGGSAGSVSR